MIIFVHMDRIPSTIHSILHGAFSPKAAGGGVLGYGITIAMKKGISRGVFSNEAGLGSSVTVHTNSDTKEPVVQGMWGIFEVFTDTVVMCTITALTILTSGVYDEGTYLKAMALDAAQGTTIHFDSLPNGVPSPQSSAPGAPPSYPSPSYSLHLPPSSAGPFTVRRQPSIYLAEKPSPIINLFFSILYF